MQLKSIDMMYKPQGDVVITATLDKAYQTAAASVFDETNAWLADKKSVEITIEKKKEKRSLDANAYFWVLAGKLAAKINIASEDIYRELVKDIGENYYVTPIKDEAVEEWKRIWASHGIAWLSEEIGASKHEGYTNVINYYGSSEYNREQMSRLIERIVEECQAQDIETKTPEELENLLNLWGESG